MLNAKLTIPQSLALATCALVPRASSARGDVACSHSNIPPQRGGKSKDRDGDSKEENDSTAKQDSQAKAKAATTGKKRLKEAHQTTPSTNPVTTKYQPRDNQVQAL